MFDDYRYGSLFCSYVYAWSAYFEVEYDAGGSVGDAYFVCVEASSVVDGDTNLFFSHVFTMFWCFLRVAVSKRLRIPSVV